MDETNIKCEIQAFGKTPDSNNLGLVNQGYGCGAMLSLFIATAIIVNITARLKGR